MANPVANQQVPLGPSRSTGVSSNILHNAELRAAKIETVDDQLFSVPKTVIKFQVVAREAAFTDTTIANYNIIGQNSSYRRFLRNDLARRAPLGRGELTAQFESVTPKTLSFDMILRADKNYTPRDIKNEIIKLQSLCYPRIAVLFNPPLCRLTVLDLYSLECYVTQILVTWTNYWHLTDEAGFNLPMGADVNLSVLMHQYPTREAVLKGATFHTQGGTGYAGVVADTAVNRIGQFGE